jgi:hypothetical protein
MASIGGAIIMIAQLALLVLHYGGSDAFGISWGALPWWVVWFPLLFGIVMAFFSMVIVGIVWSRMRKWIGR